MVPYSKEGGWNIPALGRWVGVVVVVSALVVGAYDLLWVVATASETEDRIFLQILATILRSVLSLGASGVIIILLAELLDRVTLYDDAEEAEDAMISDKQDSAG